MWRTTATTPTVRVPTRSSSTQATHTHGGAASDQIRSPSVHNARTGNGKITTKAMKDLFNHYKYKIGYTLSIIGALLVTYVSVDTLFSESTSGQVPDVMLHIGAFFLTIILIVLAICFNIRDRRER